MRKARLLVLIACVLLWPTAAHANFWGWLEQMSGPGPFSPSGPEISVAFLCNRGPDGFGNCWSVKEQHPILGRFVLRFGRFTSDDKDSRFSDLPSTDPDNLGSVRVSPVAVLYLVRRGPFDFGGGGGFWRVGTGSGARFPAFYRFTVPVSAAISPFALRPKWRTAEWTRSFRFEVGGDYVPSGFKGSDFNNTRTTFNEPHEFLTRAAFVIDGLALLSYPR